ncbi:MAG: hypothetical protein ACRD5L_18540 [Bryobacteraceae bacterium]
MKTHHKVAAFALALAIGTGGSFVLAQQSVPTITPPPISPPTSPTPGAGPRRGTAGYRSRQPHMEEALLRLREARNQLDMAEHDKGGFRERAIGSIDTAIKDVNDGIEYAIAHPEEFRGAGARGTGRGASRGTRRGEGTATPPAGS